MNYHYLLTAYRCGLRHQPTLSSTHPMTTRVALAGPLTTSADREWCKTIASRYNEKWDEKSFLKAFNKGVHDAQSGKAKA